jgi:tRNA nucleotidyltransferase/poly(A) polymerase
MSAPTRSPELATRAPDAVGWIVRTLEEAGFETWAVGGAIRDLLLGVGSVDWDFATRARPGEVRRVFRRTVPIGIEHGTVGVLSRDGVLYEVTTFRRDVETTGRHAVVEFADRVEEDLARRDFTINAVAWHPLRDELFDPFDGAGDLERRLLRTVGDPFHRFAEDYLRVLRALRFAGRFTLTIDPATWAALVDAVEHLGVLSPERVREELVKILRQDPRPSGALTLWAASGALDRLAPELSALVGTRSALRRPGGGPAGTAALDAWAAGVLAADTLPSHRWESRLGALVAEAGAPHTVRGHPEAEAAGSPGDEGGPPHRGVRRVAALLSRLRFSNAEVDRIGGNVAGGADPPPAAATPADLRRWLARVGPDRLPDLVRIWGARARIAEARGAGGSVQEVVDATRRLRGVLATDPPLTVGDLALDGRDLIRMGMKPGPRFGEILESLLEVVLEDPAANEAETLAARVRSRWMKPDGGEEEG